MMDWEEFNEELEARLAEIPAPTPLASKILFHAAVEALTGTIQDMIHTTVPITKPSPHAKRWWNKELLNLKKKKNRLSSSSYKNRAISKHPAHEEHRKICNEYGEAIIQAKQNHWNDFLEDISNGDVWIVNQYISSSGGNGGRTRIPTLTTTDQSGAQTPLVKAVTNEEKSQLLVKQCSQESQ
jgi:hypothetical protein